MPPVPLKGLGRTVKGVAGGARGCERRHTCPELDGLLSRAFLHRKARPRLCPRTPPFATTGTVPIRWGGAMTFKMLFLIALMAPILLTALGALIHGPDASTTEQD